MAEPAKKKNVSPINPKDPNVISVFDLDDSTYDPDEVWPEVVNGRGVTSQMMWVTPELARKWLAENTRSQRNIRHAHLGAMVDDIKNGRFVFTGQPIIFDRDGKLVDGQHRLRAISISEMTIRFMILRNVSPDAFYAIDNTAKRTLADVLRADDHENVNPLACAARLLDRYRSGKFKGMGSWNYSCISTVAGRDLVDHHPGLEMSVHLTAKAGKYSRAWGAVAFCHFILSEKNSKEANEFFYAFGTGEGLFGGNPILALRKKFEGGKDRPSNEDIVFLIFKAWNLYRSGKAIQVLKIGDSESLPIPI